MDAVTAAWTMFAPTSILGWVGAFVGAPVACLVLFLLYRAAVYPLISPLRHLPGPSYGLTLNGSVPQIMREQTCAPQWEWVSKYGKTITYRRFLNQEVVLTVEPELIKRVLVTNHKSYPKSRQMNRMMSRVVGLGLLTTEREAHSRQRNMLKHHFQFANLKNVFPVFVRKALELADVWDGQAAAGGAINVNETMARFTLDVIGTSGFGFEFDAMRHPDSVLSAAIRDLLPSLSPWMVVSQLLPWTYRNLPVRAFTKQIGAVKTVREQVATIVEARVTERARREKLGLEVESEQHGTLLDIMLHDKYPDGTHMTPTELADQVMTFLLAGHETTSNALTWTWMLLDKHPEVAEKLRQEVLAAFPDGITPESFTADDLSRMPYLWAVTQESLRLYPPAPLTNRRCIKDDVWDVNGKQTRIPKGTVVFMSPFVIQRLPEFWGPDADKFRPERWYTDEAMTKRLRPKPYTFSPFLYGERSCIGQRFAVMEMQAALAILVSRFKLRMVPGVEWKRKLMVTMRPSPDLQMTIHAAAPAPAATTTGSSTGSSSA